MCISQPLPPSLRPSRVRDITVKTRADYAATTAMAGYTCTCVLYDWTACATARDVTREACLSANIYHDSYKRGDETREPTLTYGKLPC